MITVRQLEAEDGGNMTLSGGREAEMPSVRGFVGASRTSELNYYVYQATPYELEEIGQENMEMESSDELMG